MPQCKCKLKDLPFSLGLSWLTSFLQKCLHGDKMGWQEIVKCVKYKFVAGSTYYFLSMSPLQACQLKRDTITYEEKEQQLVSDCVKELREWDAHEHSKVTYCIFSLECSFFKTLCVCVCVSLSQVSPTARWCLWQMSCLRRTRSCSDTRRRSLSCCPR